MNMTQHSFVWQIPVTESIKRTLKKRMFYLPEDGIYCAAKEAFPCFRRQEFGSEDRHELIEVNLSITWKKKLIQLASNQLKFWRWEDETLIFKHLLIVMEMFSGVSYKTYRGQVIFLVLYKMISCDSMQDVLMFELMLGLAHKINK